MQFNLFAIIILVVLAAEAGLHTVADILNVRALRTEVPPDVAGIYPPDEYRRSQEYTRTTLRFDILARLYRLALLLAFWLGGGFATLEGIARQWSLPEVLQGVAYIGILMLGYSLLTLPLSLYATFVIEERFGFNRTTLRTFLLDQARALALAGLLGGPLLSGVLALFLYAGPPAWVYGWITVTLASLAVQFAAPMWLLPLFNRFTPLPPGELRDAIFDYAGRVKYPLQNVFVIDGSKRSTKSNAYFTGFGSHKRIALYDTLVEQMSVPQLVGVLTHEIGHYKLKHVPLGILVSVLHTGVMFFLLSLILGNEGLYRAFGLLDQPVYAGLVFFSLLYTPVELIAGVLLEALSRHNERGADRYAAETVGRPEALAEALQILSSSNLSNLTPHPFYVFLNYSHPPVLERLRRLRFAPRRPIKLS